MSSSASSSRSPSPQPGVHENERKRKKIVREKKEILLDNLDLKSEESEHEAKESTPAEEPVLSHKERRKRKKEEKLTSTLAEVGNAMKKRKLKDGSAKVVDTSSTAITKRQNSIWVGNLSFKTTQENLKHFFKDCGEITRIHMPTKASAGPGMNSENRGYAYIDFATPESKRIAIALSEQPLLGRKLLIKDGDDFTGRPAAISGEATITDPALAHRTHSKTAQKILRAQKQPPAPTLFLGNLGFETTEGSIRELFEAHKPGKKKGKEIEAAAEEGEHKAKEDWIRKIRMGTFEDSGLCKGFAFVDFTTVEHATAALIDPKNHHLNGRNLVVEYASPDAVRRGAPKTKTADGSTRLTRQGNHVKRRAEKTNQADQNQEVRDTDETAADNVKALSADSSLRKQGGGKERSPAKHDGVRQKGPKSRPKPGAALALAKRESAAIIPSQGRKITF